MSRVTKPTEISSRSWLTAIVLRVFIPSLALLIESVSPIHTSVCAMVSRVEKLPNELLAYIFTLATHGAGSDVDKLTFPTTIASVNRHFRRIALSTPRLWTTITLSSLAYPRTYLADKLWLIRSRAAPLDIVLDLRDPAWTSTFDENAPGLHTPSDVRNIFHVLAPHVRRWRTLQVLTDTWEPMGMVIACLTSLPSAPQLESLELMRCNEFASYRTWSMASERFLLRSGALVFGDNTPMLTSVVLSGVHLPWLPFGSPETPMLLQNLTHLELSFHASDLRPTLPAFRAILTANQNTLQSLILSGSGPQMQVLDANANQVQGQSLTPITLAELETFNLGYPSASYGRFVLEQLFLPRLRILSLEDVSPPTDMEAENSLPVLLPWGDSDDEMGSYVERVTLSKVHASYNAFAMFFCGFRELQCVVLERSGNEAVDAILHTHNPKLEELVLRGMQETIISEEDMWMEEYGPEARKVKIRIELLAGVDVDFEGDVERLRQSVESWESEDSYMDSDSEDETDVEVEMGVVDPGEGTSPASATDAYSESGPEIAGITAQKPA